MTTIGRGLSAAMKVAQAWEQPQCLAECCGRRARLEGDHRWGREYAKTRITRLDDVDQLCEEHHDKKTYKGWELVEGTGIRPMVPPDDARHPANASRRARLP